MKICAVQHRPMPGDIAGNTARHLSLIELAIAEGADLVFFPELSLTGYEPRIGKSLVTDKTDPQEPDKEHRQDRLEESIGINEFSAWSSSDVTEGFRVQVPRPPQLLQGAAVNAVEEVRNIPHLFLHASEDIRDCSRGELVGDFTACPKQSIFRSNFLTLWRA